MLKTFQEEEVVVQPCSLEFPFCFLHQEEEEEELTWCCLGYQNGFQEEEASPWYCSSVWEFCSVFQKEQVEAEEDDY